MLTVILVSRNLLTDRGFEICKNYQNMVGRHKVSKCCWKNGADRLLNAGLPQTFNCQKCSICKAQYSEEQ